MSMAEITDLLETVGPMSLSELMAMMGKRESGVFRSLQRLRDKKLVRVADYRPPPWRGRWTPVYALGSGPDVPEPARLTSSERNVRYRERHAVKISIRRYGERSPYAGPFGGLMR